jgi:hypothetical protein
MQNSIIKIQPALIPPIPSDEVGREARARMADRTGAFGFSEEWSEEAGEDLEGRALGYVRVEKEDAFIPPRGESDFVRDREYWSFVLPLEHGKANKIEGGIEVFGKEEGWHDRSVGCRDDESWGIGCANFVRERAEFGRFGTAPAIPVPASRVDETRDFLRQAQFKGSGQLGESGLEAIGGPRELDGGEIEAVGAIELGNGKVHLVAARLGELVIDSGVEWQSVLHANFIVESHVDEGGNAEVEAQRRSCQL